MLHDHATGGAPDERVAPLVHRAMRSSSSLGVSVSRRPVAPEVEREEGTG